MLTDWLPVMIAVPLAMAITSLELITSKYKRTSFALWPQYEFWMLGIIYGAIAGTLALVVEFLIANNYLTLAGIGIDKPWIRGLLIGLTTKALMQTTFFSVGSGLNPTPIGISTFVKLFEPWLTENIELGVWNKVRRTIDPHALKYPTLSVVKAEIEDNVPPHLPAEMKALILSEVERATTVKKALEIYLIYAGRTTLKRVFPL